MLYRRAVSLPSSVPHFDDFEVQLCDRHSQYSTGYLGQEDIQPGAVEDVNLLNGVFVA